MVKLENKIKNYLSINPLNLDSLPIEKYKVFPEIQGIYFAVFKSKDFLYIGQTKNLIHEGRRKREEGRRKKEEGRRTHA